MSERQTLEWLVPVQRPELPSFTAVEPYLRSVQSSGKFTNFGPLERDLVSRFAKFFSVSETQVALCANATLAIAGATSIAEPKSWILPSFTFVATPHATALGGGAIEFADVVNGKWSIAPGVRSDLGYVSVAPFGLSPEIESWGTVKNVVHDAAASIGAESNLSKLPERHAVIYSLHATKVMGSGEGAVVIFGSAESTQRFRAWTNFGFSGSREAQFQSANAKMSEIQAAYVHAALDGWLKEKAEWLEARQLAQNVEAAHNLRPLLKNSNPVSPYWIVEFPTVLDCERFEHLMSSSGIETRRWWGQGCHKMQAFAHVKRSALPVTTSIGSRYLGLPMARSFGSQQFDLISQALSKAKF